MSWKGEMKGLNHTNTEFSCMKFLNKGMSLWVEASHTTVKAHG